MSRKPKSSAVYLNAGNALMAADRPGDAVSEYQRAIEADKNSAAAWESLGKAFQLNGRFGEAVAAYEQAVKLNPRSGGTHHNLGSVLGECGEIAAAIEQFKIALSLDPVNAKVASTLLYTLWFADDLTEDRIISEHRSWAEKFAAPLKATWRAHQNSPELNRRLKVGYVSPDLRLHPIGRFMLPVFVEHDHGQFEIYGYSASPGKPDAFGERIQQW